MRQNLITKDMTIEEVVRNYPETIKVFHSHGLHCIGCFVAAYENIEQGATAHGIAVEPLIHDLNQVVAPEEEGLEIEPSTT